MKYRSCAAVLLMSLFASQVHASVITLAFAIDKVAALISAVNTSNTNGEDDTIDLAGLTVQLTTANNPGNGLPVIVGDGSLTIINGTITRSGTDQFRFLTINSGANVILNGVTLSNGRAPDGIGAVSAGGAIANSGTLTVINSTFASNMAGTDNVIEGGLGGAISNGGALTVSGSTLNNNHAGSGKKGGSGGAISNFGSGTALVMNSTFVANEAGTGSTDRGGYGGAISDISFPTSGLTVTHSTLVGNLAGTGATPGGGSAIQSNFGPLLINNILSGPPSVCSLLPNPVPNATSANNLITDTSCGNSSRLLVQGVTTTDAAINHGTLTDNGGPTATMAPLSGSPAIDAAFSAFCLATDQRGVARPVRSEIANCDVGAYEVVPDCSFAPQTCLPVPGSVALKSGKTGVAGSMSFGFGPLAVPATSLRFCLYANQKLIGAWEATAGDPAIMVKGNSLTYRSKTTLLKQAAVKTGPKGGVKATFTGGPSLPLPGNVTAQVEFVGEGCAGVDFGAEGFSKNDTRAFSAKVK